MPRPTLNIKRIPEGTARQLLSLFLTFDSDGDKKLTLSELRDFLKQAELDPGSAELALAIFDNDKSGFLEFEEFVEFAVYQELSESQPRLYFERAFKAFDTNKSGKLDRSELQKFLKLVGLVGVDEVTKALEAASVGNGLTFDKFADLFDLPPAA
jgi:hypothetical protein